MGSEICGIRIMFELRSDDEFVKVRDKIKDALKDRPDARIDFTTSIRPDISGAQSPNGLVGK